MSRVVDLDRAQAAHERVTKRAEQGGKAWRSYRTIALKLPVMIHNEGLVPALHFVAARGDQHQRAILADLARDLDKSDIATLLEHLRQLDTVGLRATQREVLRRLGWYKRMVQSLGREPTEGGTD